ncbi:unnamed protein product [Rotaria socialis]|uniref:RRM domain-containing protein n=1 Tax=Rotaria socialis TaxID=392032 RepID=A0A819Y1Q0_9BILA|nr:unnamed protein product [Rotaria socialis]CAF3282296.1 unnamed protein product [Rotaria socialis]CAF4111272.1 unnamed protein product [Rotaria socialis]CAF4147979.1 unnamed protein product [Rotaria socialis]
MNDDMCRQVFIKNIPYEIDDDALSEWCSSFGPITKCSLKRDKLGNSRGFAFITFASIAGHDNIVSNAPHYCLGRLLLVKPANEETYSNESQVNSSLDPPSQTISSTNDNFHSTTIDNSFIYDDLNDNRLASLHDELEANLECMQIAHGHEIKVLRDKLAREKKLKADAEESYKEAEEDWSKINAENIRLRTSLIKNVMQTFNIRRDLARRTKDQLKQCEQVEKQFQDIRSSRMMPTINKALKNQTYNNTKTK